MRDIGWFKEEIAPLLTGYELEYKFFQEGDLGSLNQVNFNSEKVGGNIDFWSLGWLGIFVWDFKKEEQLLNILLDPNKEEEQVKAFEKLQNILRDNMGS